jgi:hypothetical protein
MRFVPTVTENFTAKTFFTLKNLPKSSIIDDI